MLGNVNGQLQTAFSKLAALHAKNQFAFAIVTGDLFADDDDETVSQLLDGRISVPVSTYFTVGTKALPDRIVAKIEKDEEICVNLHFLGKRSITKTSEGVRIVTLGGRLDPTIVGGQSKEQHLPFHTADDAKALRGANSADILLTTVWPSSVWKGSSVTLSADTSSIPTSDAISDLVLALKPRYHFSPSPGDFFYEREPFFHKNKDDSDSSVALTRFLSLATFGNAAKAKAMYAFSLTKEEVTSIPPGATAAPFVDSSAPKKRPAADGGSYSRFANGHDDSSRYNRRKKRRDRSPPPGPDRCFFCLSNPNLPTHMVCSIGDDVYVATAKGPLPTPITFRDKGLDFPGHLIMVPLTHAPTISAASMAEEGVDGAEVAARTFKEMTRFREALQAMTSSRTKRKLGAVTWEISRARNIHTHWQFIPVPADMVAKGLVEAAFRVEAENLKLPKLEAKEFGSSDEVEGDYFRVWIWADEDTDSEEGKIIGKCLLMRLDENVHFDLQYGRKVMAKLLRLEERTVWQNCVQDEEEETTDVAAFREAFKECDFTA